VNNQRVSRRNGTLAKDRVTRLDDIGFVWEPRRGKQLKPKQRCSSCLEERSRALQREMRVDAQDKIKSAMDFVLDQEVGNRLKRNKRRSSSISRKASAGATFASQAGGRAEDWEDMTYALELVLNDPSFDREVVNEFKKDVWELARGLVRTKTRASCDALVEGNEDDQTSSASGLVAGEVSTDVGDEAAKQREQLTTSGDALVEESKDGRTSAALGPAAGEVSTDVGDGTAKEREQSTTFWF